MASGNGDIGGLKDEDATSPASSPVEGVKVDTAGGGDAFNSTTTASNESAEPLKIPPEQRSADYQKLIQCGLAEKVAAKLDDIYNTGKLSHSDLDERALDALKEFPVDGALTVLKQFLDSNLEHVSNKSAYLCGVMKTYRQKSRSGQTSGVPPAQSPTKGPDEAKIKEILERTGYSLDVTTGQRKYGGPPPGWEGEPPGNGCEVFCGKIPKDMYEDELIPLFEKCGGIWDLRLMMDPMTGLNRGYAFVTFKNRDGAQEAVRQLNEHEIRKAKKIGVTISYNNHRLFVGNIPKNRDHDELIEEFSKHAPGLTEVIIYSSPDDRKKNRGFCFLEYESHKAASLAKRRLGTSRVKVWGCDIIVDWADPQEEPDDETMSKVKVLYVRNLTQEVTEEKLKESFEAHGKVERVKKIKDYAFVHFEEREGATKAMNELNGKDVGGSNIEISLAKPPSDKKKKEEILRARERRMMQMMATRPPPYDTPLLPPQLVGRAGRGGMRGGPMGRSDFGFQMNHAGFGDVGNLSPFNPGYFGMSPPQSSPQFSRLRIGPGENRNNSLANNNNRNYSNHSVTCFGSPSTPMIGSRHSPPHPARARRSLSRGGLIGGGSANAFPPLPSSSNGALTIHSRMTFWLEQGGRGHGGMSHGRGQPLQATGQPRGDGRTGGVRPGMVQEELRDGPLPSATLLALQPQFPGHGTPLGARALERETGGEVLINGHRSNPVPKANFQQKTNVNVGSSGGQTGGGSMGRFDRFL